MIESTGLRVHQIREFRKGYEDYVFVYLGISEKNAKKWVCL